MLLPSLSRLGPPAKKMGGSFKLINSKIAFTRRWRKRSEAVDMLPVATAIDVCDRCLCVRCRIPGGGGQTHPPDLTPQGGIFILEIFVGAAGGASLKFEVLAIQKITNF